MQGPRPLPNLGNTCCFNTLFQCLLNLPNSDALYRHMLKTVGVHHPFLTFTQSGSVDDLRAAITTICNRAKIRHYDHQDLYEIFTLLVQYLEDDYKNKESAKIIPGNPYTPAAMRTRLMKKCEDFFQTKILGCTLSYHMTGLKVQQVRCKSCNTLAHSYEPFCTVNLDLQPNKWVQELLEIQGREEMIDGLYDCDSCKQKTRASVVQRLYRPPPYLVIVLKRFTPMMEKDNTPVNINYELELESLTMNNKRLKYRLSSIGCHTGNLHGGHYYAVLQKGDKFYIADDDSIYEGFNKDRVSRDAYIIFYRLNE